MSSKKINKKRILAVGAILVVTMLLIVIRFSSNMPPTELTTASVSDQNQLGAPVKAASITNNKIQKPASKKSTPSVSDVLVELWNLDKKNQFKNTKTNEDKNGKTHARYQQMYEGIPVWGGDVIVHADKSGKINKVTGKQVSGLETKLVGIDLKNPKVSVTQALDSAKQKASEFTKTNSSQPQFRNEKTDMVIYVDGDSAHQVYHVNYVVETSDSIARPNFMIDAQTGDVLKQWNGLATDDVGTGPGGNQKIGQHEFGTTPGYGFLDVTPGALNVNCTMTTQNAVTIPTPVPGTVLPNGYVNSVNLQQGTQNYIPWVYPCFRNTYQSVNGGYSPINDAHFYGKKTAKMYQDWVSKLPTDDGDALTTDTLLLRASYNIDENNAFWDGSYASFGDGGSVFYPLSSGADVVSHEISHAFTEFNSNLIYEKQSGALNEAYSDIAGEGLEFYWKGSNDWLVGGDVMKNSPALRYFENPKLDGYSITHAAQYTDDLDVHNSSGVFNRAFYLIANLSGWDTQIAFQVFADANKNYWTTTSNFVDGACGVLNAAVDDGLDPDPVRLAFQSAGVFCDDPSIILDTDADSMSDIWEAANGLTVGVNEAAADVDSDTFSNIEEYKVGSNPQDAQSVPISTLFGESFEGAGLPARWTTTFGSDTPWVPAKNASYATDLYYSLKAQPKPGKLSQVEFTSYFVADSLDFGVNDYALAFDLLISTAGASDTFKVYVDGELDQEYSGLSGGWKTLTIDMPTGKHTVLFQFSNSQASETVTAYIDNIRYTHLEPDTDGDGLGNSIDADDDNDGLSDTTEERDGTLPLVADSDGDGFEDGVDIYPKESDRSGIRGNLAAANFGNAVTAADVNGDGYDDVVVGSFRDDPVNQTTGVIMKDAGTVKVYSGADGSLLYRWLGEVAGDNFGISVANAGDVNNDGDDDIIIGATGYDPLVLGSKPLSKAGAAYVYSGAGGASWIQKFEGKVAGDNFGISVAGGNINGDTNSDLIIGANLADPIDSLTSKVMSSAGRVYVYSGASLGEIAKFDGNTAGDTFGSAVAVGDVNNDGRDDIIVGSPKDELNAAIKDSGSVYVYSGAALPTKTELTSPKGGVAASDAFGSSVAVGRIDAVAGEDIVVGAPKYDVIGITALKDAGAIYTYSGGSYNPIAALSKTGVKTGDAFGSSLAVGAIDAVAGSDVVVGVCKSDYTNPTTLKVLKDAGSVNVYSGVTGASLITGSALTGKLATQWFGCAVAAGDTNDDGRADVIIGSPNDDPSLIKDAGSVEIYSGAGL